MIIKNNYNITYLKTIQVYSIIKLNKCTYYYIVYCQSHLWKHQSCITVVYLDYSSLFVWLFKWALQRQSVFLYPSGVKLCITVLRFAFHSTEPAVKRDEMFVIREENGSVLSSVAMNKLQDEQWLTGVNPTHAVNMLLGATQNEICFSRTKCTSTLLSKNLHSFIMIKISCQYAVSSKSLRPPVEMHFHYNLYISIIYWVESLTEN